jgi:shikimate dehydrogenase
MVAISGKTKLLGLIGYPVSHSLSPLMHNRAIAELGVDYVYLPFGIKPENLAKGIEGLKAIDVKGFSITIPHKQTIMPLLAGITPRATLVGAVNTVWQDDHGQWQGTNTDVDGFLAPLNRLERDWSRIRPIVLGNGGAARAVVIACMELGCKELLVIGRDRFKLQQFIQGWDGMDLSINLSAHTWSELGGLLPHGDLLINTTPIGMDSVVAGTPVPGALLDLLPANAIVYDLIYNPRPTQLLKDATSRGLNAIDGLEMLAVQGAVALALWLQQDPPLETMKQSLIDFFQGRD